MPLKGALAEELDRTQRYLNGAGRDLPHLIEVEKILAQLFFIDLVGRFPIVIGQLPHSDHIHFLGPAG